MYGWTGASAPQASRERTPGGKGASAGVAGGPDNVIVFGAKVPSHGGFGPKTGAMDGAEGGCGAVGCCCWLAGSAAWAARPDSTARPALPARAAADERSRRRRWRLMVTNPPCEVHGNATLADDTPGRTFGGRHGRTGNAPT